MAQYIATMLDTAGIQSYIFQSNRLRENIGASYLVELATKDWVDCALMQVGIVESDRPIETNQSIQGEKVYASGGNAVVIFREEDSVIAFTRHLSRRLLTDAPGIHLVVAHEHFDWQEPLSEVTSRLAQQLNRKKRHQQNASVPLLGLGVTANCRSTQLAAVGMSPQLGNDPGERYPVSREVKAKLNAVESANRRLETLFAEVDFNRYCFPRDIDDLGRSKGESSYVAVVHADGNSMGDRFINYGKQAGDNRDFIDRMRRMSQSVDEAGQTALHQVVQRLTQNLENNPDFRDTLDLQVSKDKRLLLPFRPLVFGGDDVTFICEGRLGVGLAGLYLKTLESQNIADGGTLPACAGISIVKTHYPFARAYALSESLCQSSKRYVRDMEEEFSALDWHIANTGLVGSLKEIRQREYTAQNGKDLFLRPVRLSSTEQNWKSWNNIAQMVTTLNTDEAWRDRRNKVMALREVLRRGDEAVKQFTTQYKIEKLPSYNGISESDVTTTGWCDLPGGENRRACAYFDAIELMDFYLPLGDDDEP
jgi:hypothetical protein